MTKLQEIKDDLKRKRNFACGDEILRQANQNIQSSYCLAVFIGQEIIKQEGPKTYWDYSDWKKRWKKCRN